MVCDVLYAVLYVCVCCFVDCGCYHHFGSFNVTITLVLTMLPSFWFVQCYHHYGSFNVNIIMVLSMLPSF